MKKAKECAVVFRACSWRHSTSYRPHAPCIVFSLVLAAFTAEMEGGRGSGGSRKWVGQCGSWVSFLPKAVGHGGSWVTQTKDVILLGFLKIRKN